jgi:hypothetical protein
MTPRNQVHKLAKALVMGTLVLFQSVGFASSDWGFHPGITSRQDHYMGEQNLVRVITECRDQLKIQQHKAQIEARAKEAAKSPKEGINSMAVHNTSITAGAAILVAVFVYASSTPVATAAAPTLLGGVAESALVLVAGAGAIAFATLQLAVPASTAYDSTMAGLEKTGLQIPIRFSFNDVNEIANFVAESISEMPGIQTARLEAQCLTQVGARLDSHQTRRTCDKIISGLNANAKKGKLCGRMAR